MLFVFLKKKRHLDIFTVGRGPGWGSWCKGGPLGALNFSSGRGVRPGFPKCGACKLTFASEKGACEQKISKFGGL